MAPTFPCSKRVSTTGEHHRIQKSYIALAPIIALVIGAVFAVVHGAAENLGDAYDILVKVTGPLTDVLVLVVLIVPFALRWRFMSYVFEEHSFCFHSGVLSHHRASIPYTLAQSISYHASPLQRIFGVCTITLDRAGGSSRKPLSVPYVKRQVVERMCYELSMRKSAMQAGANDAIDYVPDADVKALDDAAVTYEYKLRAVDLLKTVLTNEKPVIAAFVVALVVVIAMAAAFLLEIPFAGYIEDIAWLIIGIAMLVVWASGLFPVLLRYGRFRVRRRGSRIEVKRGIIAYDFTSLDADCIQYVEARQSMLRRITGSCELAFGHITATRVTFFARVKDILLPFLKKKKVSKQADVLIVHPFAKLGHANEILDSLVPELAGRPHREDCHALPKAALGRALVRECVLHNKVLRVAIAIVIARWALDTFLVPLIAFTSIGFLLDYVMLMSGVVIITCIVAAIATLIKVPGAIRYARRSGYTWNDDYLLLFSTGLSASLSVIPHGKIQSGTEEVNLFQRRKSLATLQALTLSGEKTVTLEFADVCQDDADAYAEWLMAPEAVKA